MLSLLVVLMSALSHGETTPGLSPVEIQAQLRSALLEVSEESRKEQKLTGGLMVVAGGAFGVAGLFGPFIGNDYSTQTAPAVYIATSGLLTVGGIINLTREDTFSSKVDQYNKNPELTVKDIETRIRIGQDLLQKKASMDRRWRLATGWLTVAAGFSNVLNAFLYINTPTTQSARTSFEITGYSAAGLGFSDLVFEGRRSSGGPLFTLGISNAVADRIDPRAPSLDFLAVTGTLAMAAGFLRLIVPYPSERAQDRFFDNVKSSSVTTNFYLLPTPEGYLTTAQVLF